MYTTRDLTNILQLMQTSRQSGDLTVEPLEQDGIAWQGYFRLLDGQITKCQISNKTNGQVILRGEEALRWATNARHGKLVWSLEEDVQSTTDLPLPLLPPSRGNATGEERQDRNRQDTDPYHSARNTSGNLPQITPPTRNNNNPPSNPPPLAVRRESPGPGTIPKRTKPGMFTPGNTLASRDHRQVFSLIDGNKSVEEIANLLHKPSGFIARIVMDLKTMNLVE